MGTFAHVIQGMIVMAAIVSVTFACSTGERPGTSPLEPISITDVGSVAGTWEGLLEEVPPSRRDDWVRLRIQQDGTYHFEAVRTIGVFSGNGKFDVENGKLIASTDKGTIHLQLYRHFGKDDRILKGEGRSADGMTYRGELTPARGHR
jgi:hypothetical protein